jgi:hypothetical protein
VLLFFAKPFLIALRVVQYVIVLKTFRIHRVDSVAEVINATYSRNK